ncbi:MAG TPA: hypothetical protein VGF86_00275 [Candidatus Tumulicola sp.]
MDFLLRDGEVSDIDRCIPLLHSPLFCEPARHDDLRAMWRHAIETKSGITALAIDPSDDVIIHFGFTVAVSDEQAASYQTCEEPLIAQRILSTWTSGRRPFLNAAEIARADAGDGLNLVVLYYGGRLSGKVPDERMYAANYESSRRVFSGWNVRSHATEIFMENWRGNGKDWGTSLGFRIGEYTAEQLEEKRIPPDFAPCVWWATREDAGTNPGWALTLLFTSYARPHLRFTLAEQELLMVALDGYTDESIAKHAGTSVALVKKRFRAINEKVLDDGVRLGPSVPELSNGVRGAEMRRHLLNYLRKHPEELRPYDADGEIG